MKKGLVKIKRAIISVSNKDGLEELALGLKSWDIEIIASGGTAKILKEKSIEVIEVEDLTGFPEILEGRVKSLHPNIHGGILAIRDDPRHIADLKKNKILPIDLVICDLYPFEETVQKKELLNQSFLTIFPLLSIIALIPLFADLSKKVSLSIALKIDFAKCWSGPIELPNHPSSEIFIIRFVSGLDFCTKSAKIIS